MKELVVISGKGGTGKTSVVASFAALAENAVVADCDVDAADLHLVLAPDVRERHEFRSGHEAVIRQADCVGCGDCLAQCRFEAVVMKTDAEGNRRFSIDPVACEGCGVCVKFCPVQAIDFLERVCGEWYVSATRFGPLIHARLSPAAENSGKLVTVVRRRAQEIADAEGRDLVLVDGPPGIGCPVIASVAGATMVLIVTEPTVSGEHDLERVLGLARHFRIQSAVCVNKWDLNADLAGRLEAAGRSAGAAALGRIRYDPAVTAAMVAGRTAVEVGPGGAHDDVRRLWRAAADTLNRCQT